MKEKYSKYDDVHGEEKKAFKGMALKFSNGIN
jgi:hypothetical protein